MAIVLGSNSYGKAEVHLVRVARDGARHEIRDCTVGVALSGDFEATHTDGDNAAVLPTDTQKNTVFAFARTHGIDAIEDFALALADHFVGATQAITGARVEVIEHPWQRLGDHSFARGDGEVRTTVVTRDGEAVWVVSGLRGLIVLNSADSEFVGYARDRYTTLPEDRDRILATELDARFRYAKTEGVNWTDSFTKARETLLDTFATTHSYSLQHSLFAMGKRLLERHGELAEVRFSLPNKHHFLVRMEPFGLDNPGEVFHATEAPYGLIEGTVLRDDAPAAPQAW